MARVSRPRGTFPKQKVPGPAGFSSLSPKDKVVAAREWVANTSSGNTKDDSAYYDALLRQSGIAPKNNPFNSKKK